MAYSLRSDCWNSCSGIMLWVCNILLVVFLIIAGCDVYGLEMQTCTGSPKTFAVREQVENQTLSCVELNTQYQVLWIMDGPGVTNYVVAVCNYKSVDNKCTGKFDKFISTVTVVGDVSTLTLIPMTRLTIESNLVSGADITCVQPKTQNVSCLVDVICLKMPACTGSPKTFAMQEQVENQTLSCTELDTQKKVLWIVNGPGITNYLAAECEYKNGAHHCSGKFPKFVSTISMVMNVSTLTLTPFARSTNSRDISGADITCRQQYSRGDHVSCLLDVICVEMPACTGSPKTFAMQEQVEKQTVSCTGLDLRESVWWVVNGPLISNLLSAECVYNSTLGAQECSGIFPNFISTVSMVRDVSTLTLMPLTRWTSVSDIISGAAITCRQQYIRGNNFTCLLDVIYAATVTPSACDVRVNTSVDVWKVVGHCHVTKAFSTRGQYYCLWTRSAQGESAPLVNEEFEQTTGRVGYNISDYTYYNYSCRFTTPILRQSETVIFNVIAFPGNVNALAGTVTIAMPSQLIAACGNTQYHHEGAQLVCTCSAANPGTPRAILRWLHDVALGMFNLTSQDDGRVLTCQALWGADVIAVANYTLHVAYGPISVTLSVTGTTKIDPGSPSSMTLTCNAQSFNPSVTYTFEGGQCQGMTSNVCIFEVKAEYDSDVITCVATNDVTNVSRRSQEHILRVHHPPLSKPVIQGFRHYLYRYVIANLTCHSFGGHPHVTNVTFTCSGQGQEASGSSSSLVVTPSDLVLSCTCKAQWNTTDRDVYTQTTDVTMHVIYAGSIETFTANSQPQTNVSVTSGSDVTLTCTADGRPTPALRIVKGTRQLASKPQGQVGSVEDTVTLEERLPGVTTSDAGVYSCEMIDIRTQTVVSNMNLTLEIS